MAEFLTYFFIRKTFDILAKIIDKYLNLGRTFVDCVPNLHLYFLKSKIGQKFTRTDIVEWFELRPENHLSAQSHV